MFMLTYLNRRRVLSTVPFIIISIIVISYRLAIDDEFMRDEYECDDREDTIDRPIHFVTIFDDFSSNENMSFEMSCVKCRLKSAGRPESNTPPLPYFPFHQGSGRPNQLISHIFPLVPPYLKGQKNFLAGAP